MTSVELPLLQQDRVTFPQDWHTLAAYFGWFTQLPGAEAWLQAQHPFGPLNAPLK